jgi:hypothetical protein
LPDTQVPRNVDAEDLALGELGPLVLHLAQLLELVAGQEGLGLLNGTLGRAEAEADERLLRPCSSPSGSLTFKLLL